MEIVELKVEDALLQTSVKVGRNAYGDWITDEWENLS